MRTPEKAREVVDDVRAVGRASSVWSSRSVSCSRSSLLEALPLGFVNMHFSLLPRWRGAAPVERAILAGDAETGVVLMQIEAGLDTGPVFATRARADRAARDRGRVAQRVWSTSAPSCCVEQLPAIADATPEPQVGEPTYAEKLDGRRVPARSRPARGRARPGRARRQPAAGRVVARSAAGG